MKQNVRTKRTIRDGRPTKQRNGTRTNTRNADRPSGTTRYQDTEAQEPQEPQRRTRKVYRRKKVFRKWVLLVVFLVPLGIIWLEYYIGKLIDLEDVRDTYQEQVYDPWDLLREEFNSSRIRETGSIPPLHLIAQAPRMKCPSGQRRMLNVHNPLSHFIGSRRRLIPMIVHQQSKSRCLTANVDEATIKWGTMKRWSYYMHDEVSQNRLFDEYCGGETPTCEFPLLNQILSKCVDNITDNHNHHRYYSSKAELWKFLTLWIYGGVYVDIDLEPLEFSPTTIGVHDDGFLLIDSETQMLSTKLMAISPRHPIMFYAVQQMLLSILMEESPSLREGGSTSRGATVLTLAFEMFQEEVDEVRGGENRNLLPGIYRGVMGRTVRITESNEKQKALVKSIFKNEDEKEAEYQKMGMTMNAQEGQERQGSDIAPDLSCRQKLYHFT